MQRTSSQHVDSGAPCGFIRIVDMDMPIWTAELDLSVRGWYSTVVLTILLLRRVVMKRQKVVHVCCKTEGSALLKSGVAWHSLRQACLW